MRASSLVFKHSLYVCVVRIHLISPTVSFSCSRTERQLSALLSHCAPAQSPLFSRGVSVSLHDAALNTPDHPRYHERFLVLASTQARVEHAPMLSHLIKRHVLSSDLSLFQLCAACAPINLAQPHLSKRLTRAHTTLFTSHHMRIRRT